MLSTIMNNTLTTIIKKHLSSFEYQIIKQTEGYSNDVFLIKGTTKSYIIKIYKNNGEKERFILRNMSQNHILYDYPEYRVENFVKSRKVNYFEDIKLISQAVKSLHNEKIAVENFVQLLTNLVKSQFHYDAEIKQIFVKLYTKILEKFDSLNKYPLVFSHNDLQLGNILMTEEKAVLIDYEYASLNNPLFDFANIFCEMANDYSKSKFDIKKLPSEKIIKKYLQEYFSKENVDEEVKDVQELYCASHFLWYVWARNNAFKKEKGDIDFEKYAKQRLIPLKEEGLLSKKDFILLCLDIKLLRNF